MITEPVSIVDQDNPEHTPRPAYANMEEAITKLTHRAYPPKFANVNREEYTTAIFTVRAPDETLLARVVWVKQYREETGCMIWVVDEIERMPLDPETPIGLEPEPEEGPQP